jgi:Holliday junction resolvasome RuvABC endonuclease subunit
MIGRNTIRCLACDPGSVTFGWSLLEYDLTTGHVTVLKSGTILGKTLVKQQVKLQAQFEKRYIVLWELEKLLVEMITEFKPDYVVSESAFSHRFAQTFAVLTMVVQAIRTAAMRTLGRDIHLIAPRESKKAVSHNGAADKATVQDAIFNNPNITINVTKNNTIADITEHAYDSIAAGMAFVQNYLPALIACEKLI